MKILVSVKRVVDYKAVIRIKSDGSDVDIANLKMSINPFDEIAIEEAIRLKEKGLATEVVTVTIGPSINQDVLRTSLAMGADRGLLVKTDLEIQPLAAAKILQQVVAKESPQLIILGKQAIDSDNNQVGQMLAGLLNWGQGTFASQIEFQDNAIRVTREIDGGLETLWLKLPALVTTDLRLNQPRYIALPNIMKAKTKPMNVIDAAEFDLDLKPRIEILKVEKPAKNRAGIKLPDAKTLVEKLKNEAQVI